MSVHHEILGTLELDANNQSNLLKTQTILICHQNTLFANLITILIRGKCIPEDEKNKLKELLESTIEINSKVLASLN